MLKDGFDEGVAPGGLKDADDIKILICYLLKSVGRPLSFSNLNDILQHDGLCNYFEFANALHELLVTGHIDIEKVDGEDRYKPTSLGISTAALFERRLPKSVRDKAVNAAMKLLAKIKRDAENKVEIAEVPSGGYEVTCTVYDMGDTLASVKLYVTDMAQAQSVKTRFQQSPETIYKGVLALLTGDKSTFKELI